MRALSGGSCPTVVSGTARAPLLSALMSENTRRFCPWQPIKQLILSLMLMSLRTAPAPRTRQASPDSRTMTLPIPGALRGIGALRVIWKPDYETPQNRYAHV